MAHPFSAEKISLHDPHAHLGLHTDDKSRKMIRLFRPGATEIFLEILGEIKSASKKGKSGFFEYVCETDISFQDYQVYHNSGLKSLDPYAFLPTIGELDTFLFNQGTHYKLYEVLGAHPIIHQGISGVKFAVWAPGAKAVFLVADFNHWDGRMNPMRSMGISGLWELFVPGLKAGEKYKFEIVSESGEKVLKADPMAHYSELRPSTASIVAHLDDFSWTDEAWMEKRKHFSIEKAPMLIYELHLGSWKKDPGFFPQYRKIAHDLAAYVQKMGFTHIELLPVMEHPLDESWGYQVTGFFAPTSRYGTPEDFQYFVDVMHQNHIGVILDWVPAHFPMDEHALRRFDGTALYEHEDPKLGVHPHWNTLIFNYGRHEVANFLIASALFWLDKMHIDGLRVDAVASMLYLDYGRKEGEWIPNREGGKENLEAIAFLKHLNAATHEKFPGVVISAEESTSFLGITHPLSSGGLGFDLKWNMGWMNDTLHYFTKDCLFRKYHQHLLTFGLVYAFSEKFLLVLSHDEVVHGKGSLLSKMPGDEWQKWANMRLLYSYMICQPGKKLLFMGAEIGVWSEWNVQEGLPWHFLEYAPHQGLSHMVEALNHFYLTHPALWQKDSLHEGFEWIDFADHDNSVISYLRKSENSYLAVVHNFTPSTLEDYLVRLPNIATIREAFNTDANHFGGCAKVNPSIRIVASGFVITLSPLATAIFEVQFV